MSSDDETENRIEEAQTPELIAYEHIVPKLKCLSNSPKYENHNAH